MATLTAIVGKALLDMPAFAQLENLILCGLTVGLATLTAVCRLVRQAP